MTWEHFREKATYDWADSTTLGMISKIDSLGPAEQIIEMIEYHLDDESSTRLMNRAIKDKVAFTPEQAAYVIEEYLEKRQSDRLIKSMLDSGIKFPTEIIVSQLMSNISAPVLNRLVKEGAGNIFSEDELDELEGEVDEDAFRAVASKVMDSEDIGAEIQRHLDEHFLSDEDMRASLDRILDASDKSLTAQQVCDMAQDMYEAVADVLVKDVVDRGLQFTPEQVMQLVDVITDPTLEYLVRHTDALFSEAELEALDGRIDDDLLAELTNISNGESGLADEMILAIQSAGADKKDRILQRLW